MPRKRRARKSKPSLVIEGRVRSPIEIAASSIPALAQAIDNRMQGRRLLRELGGKIDWLGGEIHEMRGELREEIREVRKVLDERLLPRPE